jgi:hypothetical protein
VWEMTPEEAFGEFSFCENANPTHIGGGRFAGGYRVSHPGDWVPGPASEFHDFCTLFAPTPIPPSADGSLPPETVIIITVVPGGDFGPGGTVVSEAAYTVAGMPAIRYEVEPAEGGFISEPTVIWIVGIYGQMPGVGNDVGYLALQTDAGAPGEFSENVDVLDRMVATLDIIAPP